MSLITPYQAKYFAYELLKRASSDSTEKFGAALLDAKVELNPHQVEAALFAFKSPYSKGAILADEVGLGKTIEAGILLSQQWAENKRRILIICPSSLRKQWFNELADKFYLNSEVIESKNFNVKYKAGVTNPFDDNTSIKICSYQYASKQYLTFIDPKGIRNSKGINDAKIQFFKYLEEKVQPQVANENLVLNSFIILNTKWLEVNWKDSLTVKDFNKNHEYFQEDQNNDYVKLMLKVVIS
jgi:SNF2 family DNA or RNA helicase